MVVASIEKAGGKAFVAGTPVEAVVTVSANQDVVTCQAKQQVVPCESVERVGGKCAR